VYAIGRSGSVIHRVVSWILGEMESSFEDASASRKRKMKRDEMKVEKNKIKMRWELWSMGSAVKESV
jgi:hypothetical protein